MGRNFTAYLGHRLKETEIFEMEYHLNSGALRSISDFIDLLLPYNSDEKQVVWKAYKDDVGGTVVLDGPCGITLTFSKHVCRLGHYTRWITFLLNDLEIDFRNSLRNICRELSEYLKSTFALYVPDSGAKESAIMDFMWGDENKPIEYMREWLLDRCGPPADNIEAIYKEFEDHIETDGYYIDEFV